MEHFHRDVNPEKSLAVNNDNESLALFSDTPIDTLNISIPLKTPFPINSANRRRYAIAH